MARVLWRYDMKLRNEIRKEGIKERRRLYGGQNWPFFEASHDRLQEELLEASRKLEMVAMKGVGLSRKNWLSSLQAHFAYPGKDGQLHTLYKEVLEEFRKPILEEQIKCLSVESMGPAWRWLILRDSETEDNMVPIIQKGDRSMYHKIKAYEQAKTEDALH